MCSPVGHSLAALAIGISRNRILFSYRYVLFYVFSGNAADLDLLVGWILGDINKFHRLGSHSIAAAIIYGGVIFFVSRSDSTAAKIKHRQNRIRLAVTGAIIYLSHCLLDLISQDHTQPVGIQLFWPVSEQFYFAPFTVFRSFLHHTTGSDMWGMITGLFVWHNLVTVVQESVILLPVLLLCLLYRNRARRKAQL